MVNNSCFRPGERWLDTDGNPIQAHGGGVLFVDGVYYWYGENKAAETIDGARVPFLGFSAYASPDLLNWRNLGVVLPPVANDPDHDLHPAAVPERPKVLFNPPTGNYVMWMHIDRLGADGRRYLARTGVAVATHPAGPFRYLGSFRPNGCESRDMTVFRDADGSGWLYYASNRNADLHVTRLTEDFRDVETEYTVLFPGAYREAPAVYRRDGKYYLFTSGCTGWFPNAASYAVAEAPSGPWTPMGNPCRGTPPQVERTFDSQITFILPLADRPGAAIVMADRWNPENLRDSRYVWLPLQWEGISPCIGWRDRWTLQEDSFCPDKTRIGTAI